MQRFQRTRSSKDNALQLSSTPHSPAPYRPHELGELVDGGKLLEREARRRVLRVRLRVELRRGRRLSARARAASTRRQRWAECVRLPVSVIVFVGGHAGALRKLCRIGVGLAAHAPIGERPVEKKPV